MYPLSTDHYNKVVSRLGIPDVATATIRQICMLADVLETEAGESCVHLEIGNPGLPANAIGVAAEREALEGGVAGIYPTITGMPRFKQAASNFIRAFLNIDVPAGCIIPTIGSMQGSYASMLLLSRRDPKKDTMLFINPGFPVQPVQAKIIGLKQVSFDIYDYRGDKLEQKLEEILSKGNVTGMIYSNPNNPAWTNLTERELEIIGRQATKHDVIVLEDLAYMGMDFRTDFGHPSEPPYIPSVANYTDNFILLISASKIFSYAGQRIGMTAMGPKVFEREYPALKDFFNIPKFGNAFVFGILYALSSGTAHSAQMAMAAMMEAAVDGKLNFVDECRAYQHAGRRAKQIFLDNGFHIVYDHDGDRPVSDGFFFTAGYRSMTSKELQEELLRYGVATINLPSTGSEQTGLRICISKLNSDETFETLNQRLKAFRNDH